MKTRTVWAAFERTPLNFDGYAIFEDATNRYAAAFQVTIRDVRFIFLTHSYKILCDQCGVNFIREELFHAHLGHAIVFDSGTPTLARAKLESPNDFCWAMSGTIYNLDLEGLAALVRRQETLKFQVDCVYVEKE